jgi:hypothetical protein
MLRRFEAEESGGNPYRSEALSQLGLADWPDLMRQAIADPDGNEVTLAARLKQPGYWQTTETYVRNGVSHQRRVNAVQASERLAVTEFNTWCVAGLAARFQEEEVVRCRVYRAGIPKWPGSLGAMALSGPGPNPPSRGRPLRRPSATLWHRRACRAQHRPPCTGCRTSCLCPG